MPGMESKVANNYRVSEEKLDQSQDQERATARSKNIGMSIKEGGPGQLGRTTVNNQTFKQSSH